MAALCDSPIKKFPAVVDLNVGGRHSTTSLSTLTKYPDSMLGAMFSGQHDATRDKDGRYFIDMDGDDLQHVLRFLRFQKIQQGANVLSLLDAAEYLGLAEMSSLLSQTLPVKIHLYYQKIKDDCPQYETKLGSLVEMINRPPLSHEIFVVVGTMIIYNACYRERNGSLLTRYNPVNVIQLFQSQARGVDQAECIVQTMIRDLQREGVKVVVEPERYYMCSFSKSIRINEFTRC